MELWICGQVIGDPTDSTVNWELSGVFDSKDKAIAACRDQCYFIAPTILNEQAPHESVEFPISEYPLWGK